AQVKKYDITFSYNGNVPAGASALPSAILDVAVGDSVTLPSATAPAGYAFSGWSEVGNDASGTFFNMPAEDLHFEGSFIAQPTAYKVEHYLENTTGGYPSTPSNTENLAAATDSTVNAVIATHYGFTHDDTYAGNVLSDTVKADGSTVLKVYYKRNQFTLSYQYDNTPAGAPALPAGGTYRYGQQVTVAPKASLAGYTFNGWALHTGEASITDGILTMPDSNVTLHGSFTANSGTPYRVEHYFEKVNSNNPNNKANYELDNNLTENKTGVTDQTVTAVPYAGTVGVKYEAALSTASGTVAGDGSLVLKLYYSRARHTVTYQYLNSVPGDATALPTTATYKYGETVTVAPNATAIGYTFSGWERNNVPAGASFSMPAQDVVISGHFTPAANKYVVEHYVMNNDGSWPTTTDHIHEYDDAKTGDTATATVTMHSGFTYDEAKTTAAGNQAAGVTFVTVDGKQVPTATVKADGTTVLKLYYARNPYSITYVFEGDVPTGATPPVDSSAYFFEQVVTLKPRPSIPGYTFNGWSIRTGETYITADNTMAMPRTNVTLYGSFTANSGTKYTVEHYFENLSSNDPTDPANYTLDVLRTETLSGTTAHTATAVPLSDTVGVKYEAALSTASGTIAGDGSLVLKLYYSRARHTVKYQYLNAVPADATALPATVTYKYGETVTVAPNATATGYTFSGWERNNAPAGTSFTMPAQDVILSGYFSPAANKYVVKVYEMNVDGTWPTTTGHVHEYTNVNTNDIVTATLSEITGFTYDEAKTTAAGSQAAGVTFVTVDGKQVPTASVKADGTTILNLYFSRNQFSVSYEYYGANIPSNVSPACDSNNKISEVGYGGTYYYGQEVTIAPNATDNNSGLDFTFSGWSIRTGDTAIVDGKMIMPNSDVVLRGSFTATGNTDYIVEHYFQNSVGDEYTLRTDLTQTFHGAANSSTTAMPRSGDKITGFSFNADKSASTRTGIITDSPTLTLRLYYDRTVHTVTYQYTGTVPGNATPGYTLTGGIQLVTQYTARYGEPVSVQGAASANGYTFSGWTPRVNLDIVDGLFNMPAGDVTFTGHFTANPNKYRVEHYLMDTNGNYPAVADHYYDVTNVVTDQHVSVSTDVDHVGFTFDSAASNVLTGTVAADGSTVLKVYFKRNQFSVSYQYDGSVPAGASILPVDNNLYYFGQEVTLADNATAQGYIFTGWSIHTGDTAIIDGKMEMPNSNVILHGAFNADPNTPYTVKHYWEKVDSTDHNNAANYTLFATETLSGTTGTLAYAEPISDSSVVGFSYNAGLSTVSGNIAADGSLVLELYYKRMDTVIKYQFTGTVPTGAILPADVNTTYGATAVVADIPTVQGYRFDGWFNELNLIIAPDNKFAVPAVSEIIFSGRYTANPNKYRVEHYLMDTNGNYPTVSDHYYEVTNVVTDQHVSVSTNVEHVGFTFDSAASNVLSGTVAANGSTVLKVYFKRNQFSVTYQYDGTVPAGASAPPVDNTQYYFGQEVTVADNATAQGYLFTGWSIHTGDTAIIDGKMVMPNSNVILHGAFNADPNTRYTVEHYLELADDTPDSVDFTAVPDVTVTKSGKTGTTVYAEPLSDASILGFNYDTTSVATGVIAADGSLVIKLYYKRTLNPVIYEYIGTVPAGAPGVPAADNHKYGAEISIAENPVVNGYTFSGWAPWDSTAVSVNGNKFTMPERTVYLHGSFTANPSAYTVNYFLQNPDGSYPTVPTSSSAFNVGIEVGQTVMAIPTTTYRTYSYDEAATVANNANTKVEGGIRVPYGTVNAEGTLVLNLYYSRNSYDLSYEFTGIVPDGASAPAAKTDIAHGSAVALDSPVIPAGYKFDGWYHGSTLVGSTLTMPSEDTVVTGSFSAKTNVKYTVEYYLEKLSGGYELDSSSVLTGTTGAYVAAPRVDYTGFTVNIATSEWNGHVKGDGSLVLKLYYDRNVHTVSYHYHGEDPAGIVLPAAKNYKYGETFYVEDGLAATAPDVFRGWYTPSVSGVSSSDENAGGTAMIMPNHDVVFYGALFSYSVSYDLAGGTLNGADTVTSREVAWDEANLIPDGTPEKSGYDFSGWTYLETSVTNTHKYSDLALNYTVVNITLVANYTESTPATPPAPPAPTTGSAKLVKVDAADSTTVLADVVFKLFDSNGTELGTYTTNASGEITVSNMAPGSYYWQEILPAEGYTVDSTHHEFTVAAGNTASVTVTNTRTTIPSVFTGDHYAYIIGYEDGMVHPEKNISRAEVATIFFRLLDDDVRTESITKENPFSDVNVGNWFNTAVSTMYNLGILNGYEDGTFRPNAPITRAEFAAIAARFDLDGDASNTAFKDIYEHWGRREINIAANNGWVLGYEDGTFKPNELVTRAEAMAMVNRVLQRIPQTSADLLPDMIKWPDNQNTTKWYYMVIQEATNSHYYIRKDSGYEKWSAMREGRDWDAIEN
ncbi:MAG: InlB B-repeat-containing protein, partial [Oscillospiraceae bacterium]|nr:InlB B-repeat-containing protein [Oscillospiraceae bacterium]